MPESAAGRLSWLGLAARCSWARCSWTLCTLLAWAVAAGGAGALAAEPEFVGILARAVEDDVAERLGLSDEQRERLLEVIDQREAEALELALELRDVSPDEREKKLAPFRQESERQGLAVLSDEQRRQLAALQGPGAEQESGGPRQETVLEQLEPEPEPAAEEPAPGPLEAEQETPAEPAADDSPAAEKTPAGELTSDTGERLLRFNFRFQPWSEVLDWFAGQADLSLVMDAPPPGTFNYTDSKRYTPAQAIDLLNSVLLTKGYTLVRRERMLMVINLEDGIPPNLVPRIELDELNERGEFELVSVLFPLVKLTTEEAEQEVTKLIGPQGAVVKLPKAQQILVTETAGRLRTILSVIESIENPEGAGGLRIFELEHIGLDTAMNTVRQLLDLPADTNSSSDGTLRVALDPAGNRILARGAPDKVARLAEVLDAIDVAGAQGSGRLGETPQLEVYSVPSADPASVLAVLQTLMAGRPDVRLATDPRTGNVVALARPSDHATIRATIAQLERDGSKLEVIRLRRVDPQLAVLAINKLFGAGDGGSATAPKVDAEPTTRQLLVRGSDAQIAQIRQLLERMGEAEGGSSSAVAEGSNVRMVPLTGNAALRGLEQIQQLWPALYRNRIRVVTPSAIAPTMREQNGSAAGQGQPRRQDLFRSLDPIIPRPEIGDQTPESEPESEPEDRGRRRRWRNRDDDGDDDDRSRPERDDSTGGQARDVRFRLAGETRPDTAAEVQPLPGANLEEELQYEAPEPDEPSQPDEPSEPDEPAEPSPIIVAPGPGGIMVASEDIEALDAFENLLGELARGGFPGGKQFTVFYLQSASASAVAATLGNILGGGSVSSGGSRGGSLLSNIAGAALGDAGGGMMGALLGLDAGGDGGGAVVARGSILIVPDQRLNALVIEASPNDLDTIEQLLEVLDQPDAPDTLIQPKPRLIPVRHTRAEDVANVVRQVYQDRLISNNQRQPSPEDFIRMLRGGRGGRGGGGGLNLGSDDEEQKMSIGVDNRTNSLVVSAPQTLFDEVEQLVFTLDQVTEDTTQAVRVVTLKRSNSQAVQQALSALVGSSVSTSRTPGAPGSSTPGGGAAGGEGQGENRSPEQMEEIRRRMEFFNNMQRFRGGFGGGFGGDRGGGRRGDRGGRDRGD